MPPKRQPTVVLTRRRWALLMLPAVLLIALVGGINAWLTGLPEQAYAAIPIAVIWAVVHLFLPRLSFEQPPVTSAPGGWWLVGSTIAAIVMLSLVVLAHTWLDKTVFESYLSLLFVLPLVVHGVGLSVAEKSRQHSLGKRDS